MDLHKLHQAFDQFSPTQEQSKAMLDRILEQESERKPMKKLKKTAVVLLAAALMLSACAFAVVSGLDQRLLDYFGFDEGEETLVDGSWVQVDQSHTYANGWTVEIHQALADRYSLAFLVDVIAPVGEILDGENYFLYMTAFEEDGAAAGEGVQAVVSGSNLLEDDDPEDNKLSFVWYRGPTAGPLGSELQKLSGCMVKVHPLALSEDKGGETGVADVASFTEEPWSCAVELPDADSGLVYELNQPITVDKETFVVTKLYLSPLSFAYQLAGEENDARIWGSPAATDWEGRTLLTLTDGTQVAISRQITLAYDPTNGVNNCVFQPEKVIEPAEVASVTILGQTFSLEGLIPAEG